MEQELIREINEAMAREKWLVMWQRHKRGAIAVATTALIAMIAIVLWQEQQQAQRVQESDQLLKIMAYLSRPDQVGDAEIARALDAFGTQGKGDRAALSDLIRVNRLVKAGKDDEAVSALIRILDSQASVAIKQHACATGQIIAPQQERLMKCETPLSYQPLLAEFRAVQQINAGEEAAALALLPEKTVAPAQTRRLEDLRAFLRSTHSEVAIPARAN